MIEVVLVIVVVAIAALIDAWRDQPHRVEARRRRREGWVDVGFPIIYGRTRVWNTRRDQRVRHDHAMLTPSILRCTDGVDVQARFQYGVTIVRYPKSIMYMDLV